MKKCVTELIVCVCLNGTGLAGNHTNLFQVVQHGLAVLKEQAGELYPKTGEEELLTFECGILTKPCYTNFSALVSNDWHYFVTNINQITTNHIDRLVVFGTGKLGDENLYLSYLETLAQMRLDNQISEFDFINFSDSSIESFHTVLWRRYNEPAVSNLIETLKLIKPDTNYWNEVLSGEAYQMHLEMTLPKSVVP